ncbi:hypothetical protein F511_17869 [Dorcoceras hygrometricum]|uniref:Ubiquitin-like protease family profile domain-containing protein n=1 Tax=Dorcoceras hygrometricum TaxID=472368 RepID=A0A2Z7CHP1_9LAMI|nr:hypothetical protein F511_17869 [Dorcoceras hygrometricum]
MVKHKTTKAMEMELQERTFGTNHVRGCGIADVSLTRMCHWVTRKWHKNHAPSLSDVVAAFSSSQYELYKDQQVVLYSSADHSNDTVSLYTKISRCLPATYEIVTTQILLAEPLGSLAFKMVQVRQLMEEQQVQLESADGWRCVYPRPTFFRVLDLALSMLPLVSEVTWTGSPEVAGWTKVARMFQLTPVREEESGSRESTPEAAFILVPYFFNGHWVLVRIVPKVQKRSILDSDRSVDSNGKILLDLVTPLTRMMPYVLVAMGVQTDTDTQWNIVRPKEFPKQSLAAREPLFNYL